MLLKNTHTCTCVCARARVIVTDSEYSLSGRLHTHFS